MDAERRIKKQKLSNTANEEIPYENGEEPQSQYCTIKPPRRMRIHIDAE